jgi:hypothetical protein
MAVSFAAGAVAGIERVTGCWIGEVGGFNASGDGTSTLLGSGRKTTCIGSCTAAASRAECLWSTIPRAHRWPPTTTPHMTACLPDGRRKPATRTPLFWLVVGPSVNTSVPRARLSRLGGERTRRPIVAGVRVMAAHHAGLRRGNERSVRARVSRPDANSGVPATLPSASAPAQGQRNQWLGLRTRHERTLDL